MWLGIFHPYTSWVYPFGLIKISNFWGKRAGKQIIIRESPDITTCCGWKKSCTTLDGWNPINNGINHLSTGAGFRNHPQYIGYIHIYIERLKGMDRAFFFSHYYSGALKSSGYSESLWYLIVSIVIKDVKSTTRQPSTFQITCWPSSQPTYSHVKLYIYIAPFIV